MNATSRPRCILSPCGTSLITNIARNFPDGGAPVIKYANARTREDIPATELATLETYLEAAKKTLQQGDVTAWRKASAELNGITRLYPTGRPTGSDMHFILRSDTWLGEQTALTIADWLTTQGQIAEVIHIRDLRTDDLFLFQAGMSNLVGWCAEHLVPLRESGQQVIFQLSGGFKSVQGFLQSLSTFYADEAVYIFESGQDLLRLPRLPVKLDLSGTIREHFTAFRRMAAGLTLSADAVEGIPETLLLVIDDAATLSPWGELAWDQAGKDLFSEKLWEAPSPKLQYGNRFIDSLTSLSKERLQTINIRITDLAIYLESGKKNEKNPKRLDFKLLQGDHRPSTHECDAWADGDARRLLGHFEEAIFVLDKLSPHL
jgi:putative CRISPR-associated protein (TIGR02619 family)